MTHVSAYTIDYSRYDRNGDLRNDSPSESELIDNAVGEAVCEAADNLSIALMGTQQRQADMVSYYESVQKRTRR